MKPINDGLMKETNGTLYQHSINFPAGKDAKIGWCVFEAKPESDWTTEKLKEKQDSEKAAWAVQDVYEIMKPAGIESYFMAGYIVGNIMETNGPPPPEMMTEFGDIVKSMDASFGIEKIHLGPALSQHELGAGAPNTTFIVKFATKAKALEFYECDRYSQWKNKFVTGKIKRDLRIIEAPGDIFEPGKAYWFALIHNVLVADSFGKYAGAFFANNFDFKIKFVGPSDFFEAAKDVVPTKENAGPFFGGLNSDVGIVVVCEIGGTLESAAGFKDTVEYKNALLAALGEEYSTDEVYEKQLDKFMATVLRRDVRIIGIPEK